MIVRGPISIPRRKRVVASLIGVVLGATLMGGVAYTHYGNIAFSAVIGAVLLGMLCDGVAIGTMNTATLGAVLFASFFSMIGPGSDDYMGIEAIVMAPVGAWVGWQFRGTGRKVKGVEKSPTGREFPSADF